jgi:hypothetical protein
MTITDRTGCGCWPRHLAYCSHCIRRHCSSVVLVTAGELIGTERVHSCCRTDRTDSWVDKNHIPEGPRNHEGFVEEPYSPNTRYPMERFQSRAMSNSEAEGHRFHSRSLGSSPRTGCISHSQYSANRSSSSSHSAAEGTRHSHSLFEPQSHCCESNNPLDRRVRDCEVEADRERRRVLLPTSLVREQSLPTAADCRLQTTVW